MKRIVITVVAVLLVMASLIIIPPTAMDVQQHGNIGNKASQSLTSNTTKENANVAIQDNSNNKVETKDNTDNKVTTQDNSNNNVVKHENSNSKTPAMKSKNSSDKKVVEVKSVNNKTPLKMTVANVSGKKGSTVTVPITFSNVSKVGNVGTCNFYLKYNQNALKVVSVKAGSIVASPASNFSNAVDAKKGKISLLFLDNTIGKQAIKKDGTFATVTFKIIGSKQNSPITFTNGGAVGNSQMAKVKNVTHVNGSVKIK